MVFIGEATDIRSYDNMSWWPLELMAWYIWRCFHIRRIFPQNRSPRSATSSIITDRRHLYIREKPKGEEGDGAFHSFPEGIHKRKKAGVI